MNKNEKINLGKEEITLYEFSRWASLIEAVELIANTCEDRGINFDSESGVKYIKPLDIQDYVDDRTDSMIQTISKSRKFEQTNRVVRATVARPRIFNFNVTDWGIPV